VDKRLWIEFRSAFNRKSKIQNLKWAGLLAIFLAGCAGIAEAQQTKKVPRIGYLASTSRGDTDEAFRQGLRELGYVEGGSIVIEYRFAEGKLERLSDLAADLVRLKVDVLVAAGGTPAALAAKRATATVPIVMTNIGDPVAVGLVASLARPGGNVTGLSLLGPDTAGKRLELLREVVPALSRVAVLWNPANPSHALHLEETRAAARALGVQVQSLEARGPEDFETAFKAARGASGILALGDPVYRLHRAAIIDLAGRNRLPAMYEFTQFVEAGGLMCYGASLDDLYRRAATYVDKILKGAKPADIPVEQPMKFELVINLKTAKQIGLTIPPNVLARADRVIK
jgi:putative ABC transport system substrate-binding protein